MKELKAKLEAALAVCALSSEDLVTVAANAESTTKLLGVIEDARRSLRDYAVALASRRDDLLREKEIDALAKKLGPKGMQMLIERTQRIELERIASSGDVKAG